MINAIFSLILKLVFFLIKLIITIVLALFPPFSFVGSLASVFDAFFGLLDNASALTYFLVGPLTPTIVTTCIALFGIKHILLPVVNFMRRVIIK